MEGAIGQRPLGGTSRARDLVALNEQLLDAREIGGPQEAGRLQSGRLTRGIPLQGRTALHDLDHLGRCQHPQLDTTALAQHQAVPVEPA